ncbi:MAG: preprotein translocase subunit SecE [Bacilli bacterium]|nr:preprotein translocase subunit SecE [Bacilli bacterium]MCI9585510.1 preprotein translocase subunit SecE [Bacilli bacterium]
MEKVKKFFAGVKKEMSRVRWPQKKEMIKYSVAVLVCIIVFAIFFVASDFIIAGARTFAEGLK